MAEPDRLKFRQVAILARLQAYRNEQASRQVIVARRRMAEAEQAILDIEHTYEQERLKQTQARLHRWRSAVGQELDYGAMRAVCEQDDRGYAAIEQQNMKREQAKQAEAEARDIVKNAEHQARTVHTALVRRNALKQTVDREHKHHQHMQEELKRDQQSQMLFAHRMGRSPI
ncbi:hypothetical protein [Acetobacter indonesiensis]|uniref:Uncharacterized protein n=1 Tax=Acetobacter indonesiensis TaxID=104101 RepID=A0A252AR67_9PROT|nr:hypothetical protein [Acetobacter indonesiensis]OUI92334.1 hypothetical protein HK17_10370 [Acetobacter indonesiensis]